MSEHKPPSQSAQGPRAPYEKPDVAWEEALEQKPSLMAVCTKFGGSGEDCGAGVAGTS